MVVLTLLLCVLVARLLELHGDIKAEIQGSGLATSEGTFKEPAALESV